MSTIEEAREQAGDDGRIRIWVNSNTGMSRGKYAAAAVHAALTAAGVHPGVPVIVLGGQRDHVQAMRTVIRDAGHTEVEPGTVTAGTDWAPALRALLDATEPPAQCGTELCPSCGKQMEYVGTADGNGGYLHCWDCWHAHRSAEQPAEDEREALIATRKLVHEVLEQSRTLPLDVQSAQVMLVLLDAGYSKGPRPITDEMVKAAAHSLSEYLNDNAPIGEAQYEAPARAALEAAEAARR